MTTIKDALTNHRQTWLSILLIAVAGGLSPAAASMPIVPFSVERLSNGNTLIADGRVLTGNEARVLEVDSLGRLVWAYLNSDVPFLHSACRDSVTYNTLMASSYGHKVIEVNRSGRRVWTDSTGLPYPDWASRLANGNTLITDKSNNEVIEVDSALKIVWSYTNLSGPHHGRRLPNGHTLVCDSDSNRVVEVDSPGVVVWQCSTGLSWPRGVERLSNGHTLIASSLNWRVIEVDSTGTVVWSAESLREAYAAVRLANGNTLVSSGEKVVELDSARNTVWQYPNTVPVVVEAMQVVNPSSGCTLFVHIHRPAYAGPDNRVPGVIFVPGGTGYGSSLDSNGTADDIASDGFAFMHFDPDGRGRSGAFPENYDGDTNQDGMHACLSVLASRDYVDTTRLGVYTRRYGITMGSGMIKRYPTPPVKFLLDFEGLADRYQSCRDSGGPVPKSVDSEAFWQEREAGRFMKDVPGAYLRYQPQVDSDPRIPDNRHAIQLIDSATSFVYGGAGISAWTRVNDSVMNPANQVYTLLNPPVWIPDVQKVQDEARTLLYLHELADMEIPPTAVAERRDIVPAASLHVGPRPCRGVLQVGLPAGTRARQLRVHDVGGRLVLQRIVPAGRVTASLDLRGLQPGVYYVSVDRAGTVPVVVVR